MLLITVTGAELYQSAGHWGFMSDLTDADQTVEILAPPPGDIWDKTGGVLPIAAGAGAAALGGAWALSRYSRRMRVQALIDEAAAKAGVDLSEIRDE